MITPGTRLTAARLRARRAAMMVAAVVVAMGVSAGQARAARWLAPANVSAPQARQPGGNLICLRIETQFPIGGVDVAVNAAGETIATWTRANGDEQEVQAAIRPPGGAYGPVQTLGTTRPCQLFFGSFLGIAGERPKAAIDSQGNAVVVWAHPLAATSVIQAAVRPAGGSFGAPIDLSDPSRNAMRDPDAAISANGTMVAAWTWNNGTKNVVQTATRAPGASFPPAGTATTLSDGSQDAASARVATNARGDVAVAWQRSDGSNVVAQARVRPAGGTFAATVDLSATGADANAPAVAIDPLGRSTVVWARSDLIESRSLTAAGGLDGGIDNVSDTAESVSTPAVALDADNNAVAVWTGGPNRQIKAAARASRASFGMAQTVSGPGDTNALPTVAMDPAGNAVTVWSQTLTTIQAASRPPGGSFGGVEDVSRGPGTALMPSLAVDGEGNAVVGWTFSQPDNTMVAQVNVHDAAPPAIAAVSVPATGTTGQPVAMSATATDRWSGTDVSWNLGDGGSGNGASITHTYAAAGVYTVTVTATDGASNQTSTQQTIQIGATATPAPLGCSGPPRADGRPVGVTINQAAKYTNRPRAELTIIPPDAATSVAMSNDGGFSSPTTTAPKPTTRYQWALLSTGPERLPKTVYVRFAGSCVDASQTFQDDIILDQTPPRIQRARLTPPRKGRPRSTLSLQATDNASGLSRVEIRYRNHQRAQIFATRYRQRVRLAKAASRVRVRVSDGAGNFSAWKAAHR